MGNREPIEAATACLGIVESCERQRDQRRHDEHGPGETRNDVLTPRRSVGRVHDQERRLELRAERHAEVAGQANRAEHRRENGIRAKYQLGVDERRG